MANPNGSSSTSNTNTTSTEHSGADVESSTNEPSGPEANTPINVSNSCPAPPESPSTTIDVQVATFSGTAQPLTVMRLSETTTPFHSLSQQPSTYTMPSVGSFCCRICQQGNEIEELVSPCTCKGTLAYIHLTCLQRWLNIIGRSYCEICLYRFNTIERRRYTMLRALRLWFCHPTNRQSLQWNLLRTSLLTFFVFSILGVVMFGMQVIVRDGARYGIADGWMVVVTGFFIGTILIMYGMTVYLFVKGELSPWYRWWQRCVSVEIVLDKKPVEADVRHAK